ncbi:hypothetical protein CIB84_015725 [Bambusicola thoracicus]|uniref:Ig-like domain-containing protein n=1 Tax=Bambusicola thoracicus TaxID=9083 RepID=A0A2P4S8V4_BAMTH|nr:hypothetical protein CIB84_015725 [Bambusicola thoracicus]
MDFVSLLLLFFSAVAVSRAQVQQEPSAETSEGTGINITCSHPSIQADSIHWYRQLPGRGPAFLVSAVKATKEVPDPEGQLSVSADRRSSALWLKHPGLRDAAVYYCAVNPREAKPGLRPCTNLIGRGGSQCRPCPQRALPAGPPNSILTRVHLPEFSRKMSTVPATVTR